MAPRRSEPTWRQKADPLYRGDDAAGVSLPDPVADASIVRHVLFLGGAGRPTPYPSTTAARAVAQHFAGSRGRVFVTSAPRAKGLGLGYIGRLELLKLPRGKGYGDARWPSAIEVMQARR
ncbi:MAG: hypothetical protein HY908_15645 [Myxococcales bacterium]|nr:hypothetical protein [Myxococcales bacterium]